MQTTTLDSFNQAKTLGGVGSILMLLLFVPNAGPILAVVGLILVLWAVKRISDAVNDRSIFNNMIGAVLLTVVGIVIGTLIVFGTILRIAGLKYWIGPDFTPASVSALPTSDLVGLILGLLLGLVAIWACYVVSAVFIKRSFDNISRRLNVGTFHTAALIYLIGAVTTAFFVGFLLLLVAQILFIVAFFSIRDQTPQVLSMQK